MYSRKYALIVNILLCLKKKQGEGILNAFTRATHIVRSNHSNITSWNFKTFVLNVGYYKSSKFKKKFYKKSNSLKRSSTFQKNYNGKA